MSSIEFSLVEKDVLFGIKQGSAVLKQLNSEMKVEDVEKLMSDTADGVAYQQAGKRSHSHFKHPQILRH